MWCSLLQVGMVNQSMYKLYFFNAVANVPGFQIRVAASYGDPDIYVNLNDVVPTQTNAEYRSLASASEDVLTISTSDPLFTNCTANSPDSAGGSTCRVYIAVYGFTSSQFT